jgi:hypothetical protein
MLMFLTAHHGMTTGDEPVAFRRFSGSVDSLDFSPISHRKALHGVNVFG